MGKSEILLIKMKSSIPSVVICFAAIRERRDNDVEDTLRDIFPRRD